MFFEENEAIEAILCLLELEDASANVTTPRKPEKPIDMSDILSMLKALDDVEINLRKDVYEGEEEGETTSSKRRRPKKRSS